MAFCGGINICLGRRSLDSSVWTYVGRDRLVTNYIYGINRFIITNIGKPTKTPEAKSRYVEINPEVEAKVVVDTIEVI